MKKIIPAAICIFLAIGHTAMAGMSGYDPTEMFDAVGVPGFGMFLGLGILAFIVGAFLFAFWLWMLVDCLKRDFRKDYEKIARVIVLVFLHMLGAIIYYFVVKVADKYQIKADESGQRRGRR